MEAGFSFGSRVSKTADCPSGRSFPDEAGQPFELREAIGDELIGDVVR